ncbi:MAG: putative Holliday junction resolvase [Bacteroidetes bacterium ADurb.Bin408]|nr:MAG: putative Holliday junction resolvase [Bacteroidetes bacterium ADurb.Bin408]
MGRVLAIDYGQKRTGLAVTDELQMIAGSLGFVQTKEIFNYISNYLKNNVVDAFVIGQPRQMDNTNSEASRFIEPFVLKLGRLYPHIPIVRIDERFTSKLAFQTMIEAGLKKKDRQNKGLVDSVSATIILQSYLELKANQQI